MQRDAVTARIDSKPGKRFSSSAFNDRPTQHDESGQVFTETICPGGPMTADWVWKTKGSSRLAGRFRSMGPGCSSLVDMSIRSALCNCFNITAESLREVPWEIASLLWRRLVASDLDSVKVWKAFASIFPNQKDETLNSKKYIINDVNLRLIDYINPVISLSFDWITFLALSNVTCSQSDLIQISRLTNLGALTCGPNVRTPDIGLDDSVIRSWSRTAASSNAFSMLRVFSCRSQKEITSKSFKHLKVFPALAVFNVEDGNFGLSAEMMAFQHGWRYRTGIYLSNWLVKGGILDASWDSTIYVCFKIGGMVSAGNLIDEGLTVVDSLPVLRLHLGGTQGDAILDRTGDRSLRSFYRTTQRTHEKSTRIKPSSKKLLDSGTLPRQVAMSKRPSYRAPKLQNIEELLSNFVG